MRRTAPVRARSLAVALLATALLLAGGGAASADALHVYGAPGSPTERRCFVVVEGEDGRCVPWRGLTLSAVDENVSVGLEDGYGPCVRTLVIRAASARSSVELIARGAGVEARGSVAMGGDHPLRLSLSRQGRTLTARVRGASSGDRVTAMAVWRNGRRRLRRVRRGLFRGRTPANGLVAVVARSGGLSGAGVIGRASGTEAFIAPSDLAVPPGGSPRTAAFLIAADAQGMPSRNVPLQIQSERGRLEYLRWLDDGVAAVGLSVVEGAPSVDLVISGQEVEDHEVDLSVSAGFPVRAALALPPWAQVGRPVVVGGYLHNAEGVRLAGALTLGCEEQVATSEGLAQCIFTQPGRHTVVAFAEVDRRLVPLAVRTIDVDPPSPPPPPPAGPAPVVATAEGDPPRLRLGALAGAGFDVWSRGTFAAGAEGGLEIMPGVEVSARLRYATTPFTSQGTDANATALSVTAHATSLWAGADVALGVPFLVGRAALGAAWVYDAGSVDGVDGSTHSLRPVGLLTVGPMLRFGSFWVALDGGVRVAPLDLGDPWAEAPLRFVLEVRGGVELGR